MEKLRVGVLIANFNYSLYLEKALQSCLNQTYSPSVVCIVDDKSTDNSWDIISSFISPFQTEEQTQVSPDGDIILKVGRIRDIDIVAVRLSKNGGPSTARNCGIRLIKHSVDAIQMLDADDEMLPNKIEELVKPFENPQIGLCYANYWHVSENGIRTYEVKQPFDLYKLNQECIVHSGFMVRTRFLEMVKEGDDYFSSDMRTCEDWEIEIKLSKVCLFYHIPIALTNVLVHQNNSTFTVDKSIWERNWQRIREKHFS